MTYYDMIAITSKRHFRHVLQAMGSTVNTTIRLNQQGDYIDLRAYLWTEHSTSTADDLYQDEKEFHNHSPWNDHTVKWKLPLCEKGAKEKKKMKGGANIICQPCKYTTKVGKLAHFESAQQRLDVIDLIQKMMKISPEERPTAAQLLHHSFFDGYIR